MNKLGTKLGAIAMSAVMALTFAPSAAITSLAAGGDDLTDATQELSTPVYRLYNPNSGEHLFTTNENECDSLDKNGWDYETIAWYAPSTGDPVFRLYNPNHPLGDHHYTSSEEERDNLIKQGWKLDATAFNTVAEGELLGAPVYSLYNPNAYDLGMATHHLTLSEEEADGLELLGWTNEGPKFYEYAEDLDPEVEELTVSIDNTTPKVGDTLKAIVSDGTAGTGTYTYQWYADGEAIEGADDDELLVTEGFIGAELSVSVTNEAGDTAYSDETAAVGVYEELEIVSAEQTGANTVKVTFSAPATVDDKLAVKKGSVAQTFTEEFDDNTYKTKTLTFKNNLATGTYTATLTPADATVAPSTVEFEAKSSTKAGRIEIQGETLVMADTSFQKGYFFVKGYNDFEEEIPLSGLDITVAPSDGVSFDSSTGKVTVTYNDGFAVLRNVSVFAQYTGKDGIILTDQKTLEVSTIGYPSVIEFGEVKRDGDGGRADGLLTIDELASNKYYVELNVVQDQYGNDLSADDLNDLVTGATKLVTVIPSAVTPIYFGTNVNPFSEKNGKVVVFLTPGNQRPGVGQLMIVGAGGSFEKEIEIFDNPYINTLSVDIPDIYEKEWTDILSFEAVDEYDKDVNIYDFIPAQRTYQGVLNFDDFNDLVTKNTTITASGGATGGTWKVTKDTVKKTYEVKYKPDDAVLSGSIVSFTIMTAGLNTQVKTVRVNERGNAGTVVAQQSAETMNSTDAKVNLNSKVSFKDANGKVMVRTDCYDVYPQFLVNPQVTTDSAIDNKNLTTYWWCVTEEKMPEDGTYAGNYDKDGVIKTAIVAADGESAQNALLANAGNATPSYYVTLLGRVGNAGNYKVLDSKAFRFNYSPAGPRAGEKYTVTAIKSSELLYAKKGSKDTTTIEVMAKNDSGEVYKPDQSKVSLIADAPFTTDGAVVSGDIGSASLPGGDTGTVSVKVYYAGKSVDTVSIPYSNADPVPTSTEVKLKTTTRMGEDWDAATTLKSFTSYSGGVANANMTDGVLVINNVNEFQDRLTAQIKDQYGLSMKSSKVKVNGYEMGDPEVANITTKDEIANFVMTNGSQKIDFELVAGRVTGQSSITTTAATVSKDKVLNEVESWDDLVTTLKDAAAGDIDLVDENGDATTTIKITDDIEATSALVIPAGYTVEVDDGVTLDTAAYRVEVEATAGLTVDGDWYANGAVITVDGDVIVGGDAYLNNCTLQGAGTWNGNALTINLSGCTLKGGTFTGHVVMKDTTKISGSITFNDAQVEVSDSLTVTNKTTVTVDGNTTLDLSDSEITLTGNGKFAEGTDFTGSVTDQAGNEINPSDIVSGDEEAADFARDDAAITAFDRTEITMDDGAAISGDEGKAAILAAVEEADSYPELNLEWTKTVTAIKAEDAPTYVATITWANEDADSTIVTSVTIKREPANYTTDKAILESDTAKSFELSAGTDLSSDAETKIATYVNGNKPDGLQGTWTATASGYDEETGTATLTWSQTGATSVEVTGVSITVAT